MRPGLASRRRRLLPCVPTSLSVDFASASTRSAPLPAPSCSHVLDRIGEFWSYPQSQTLAELDCEEDRVLRAVLVGMLGEADERR